MPYFDQWNDGFTNGWQMNIFNNIFYNKYKLVMNKIIKSAKKNNGLKWRQQFYRRMFLIWCQELNKNVSKHIACSGFNYVFPIFE